MILNILQRTFFLLVFTMLQKEPHSLTNRYHSLTKRKLTHYKKNHHFTYKKNHHSLNHHSLTTKRTLTYKKNHHSLTTKRTTTHSLQKEPPLSHYKKNHHSSHYFDHYKKNHHSLTTKRTTTLSLQKEPPLSHYNKNQILLKALMQSCDFCAILLRTTCGWDTVRWLLQCVCCMNIIFLIVYAVWILYSLLCMLYEYYIPYCVCCMIQVWHGVLRSRGAQVDALRPNLDGHTRQTFQGGDPRVYPWPLPALCRRRSPFHHEEVHAGHATGNGKGFKRTSHRVATGQGKLRGKPNVITERKL